MKASRKHEAPPVERVMRLIALAANVAASDAEARTSALIACRLIREHALMLVPDSQPKTQAHDDTYRTGYSHGYSDGEAAARAESRPPPPPPRASRTTRPVTRKLIYARFSGRCRYCGVTWTEGDRIAWEPKLGATCLKCWKKEEVYDDYNSVYDEDAYDDR